MSIRKIVFVKGMPGKGKTYYAVYDLFHSCINKKIRNLITNLKIDGFECIHPEGLSAEDLNAFSQEGYGVLLDDFKVKSIDRSLVWKIINEAVAFYVTTSWEEDIPKMVINRATCIVTPLGKKKDGDRAKVRYREKIRTGIEERTRHVEFPLLDSLFDRILDDHGVTREWRRRVREAGEV